MDLAVSKLGWSEFLWDHSFILVLLEISCSRARFRNGGNLRKFAKYNFGNKKNRLALGEVPLFKSTIFAQQGMESMSQGIVLRFGNPFWHITRLLGIGAEGLIARGKKIADQFAYGKYFPVADFFWRKTVNCHGWSFYLIL